MGLQRQNKSRWWLICCLVLAAVCSTKTAKAGGDIEVIDLIPDLHNFLRTAPKSKEERAKVFAQVIIQAHPEIYRRPDVFKTDLPTIELYLAGLNSYLPAVDIIHRRFLEQRASIETKFLRQFPDFNLSKAKIYLMLSLFRFDGKIPHDNPRILLLGLDGLARFHGANALLPVILSHELFHLYHFQVNPLPRDTDDIPLYRLVWQEGFATYVSHLLNPDASLADVFLDPRLAAEGPRFVPSVARDLLRDLTSTDDETAAHYLSYRRGSTEPSRMGYLIGYEIVKSVAAKRSLLDLARVRGNALLRLMRIQLQALAAQ